MARRYSTNGNKIFAGGFASIERHTVHRWHARPRGRSQTHGPNLLAGIPAELLRAPRDCLFFQRAVAITADRSWSFRKTSITCCSVTTIATPDVFHLSRSRDRQSLANGSRVHARMRPNRPRSQPETSPFISIAPKSRRCCGEIAHRLADFQHRRPPGLAPRLHGVCLWSGYETTVVADTIDVRHGGIRGVGVLLSTASARDVTRPVAVRTGRRSDA